MRARWLSVSAIVGLGLVMAPLAYGAHGKRARKHGRVTKGQVTEQNEEREKLVEKIIGKVRSHKPEEVREGYALLKEFGDVASLAVPEANARLRRGLAPTLAVEAMKALAVVGEPSSSRAIVPYLRSRKVSLRRQAAVALGRTGGKLAAKWLVRALADRDERVRKASATSLGAVGSARDVPALLRALDHKVTTASSAIGTLCDKQGCEQFVSRLAQQPLQVMAPGLSRVLLRTDATDCDQLKIVIIEKVQALGTNEAHDFLVQVQQRWPEAGASGVKKRLDEAVNATATAHGQQDDE